MIRPSFRSPSGWQAALPVAVAGLLAACVSQVELARTPCPCGDGYQCCPTLHLCLEAEESCPGTYPSSSGAGCSTDRVCTRGEACHSWTNPGAEVITGPRACRRTCDPAIPCAAAESCQIAPHDGQPLADFHNTPLCLLQAPPNNDAGTDDTRRSDGNCGQWTCQGCPADKIGHTFCEGYNMYGCLVSTHPTCGIKCERVMLKQCSRCTDQDGVINCEQTSIIPDDPCLELPCASCPADRTTFCQEQTVSTCLRAPIQNEKCDEICRVKVLEPCPQECSEPGDEAFCSP